MTVVTVDIESYYDKDYSLSKMSEVEYILDDRFQAIMLAIKINNGPVVVHVGYDSIDDALSQIDWDNTALLAHNTRFDGAILAWRFGYVPKLYLDTLSMARATTHWVLGRSSLKAVSDHLGLPPKGDEVVRALGKRLLDFSPEELDAYKEYCARDNNNCYDIFQKLRSDFSARELQIIDLVLRMFILPQVQLDKVVLEEHLKEVRAEKATALRAVEGIPKESFASNTKFAALLTQHGVEVPMKPSPTGGGHIPAIARNDWAFKELCADAAQPPIIQALLATRLSVKSTIDETRAESLLKLSKVHWPYAPAEGAAWAAVPLKFSGARTHRLSGDGGTNWQNFRRASTLRRAIQAPPGYRIIHRDSSQIEARMVAWMADCETLLAAFREGRDVYSEFASIIYNQPVTKADVLLRFVGKTGILGLGYSCGAARFRHMLYIGNGGISLRIDLDEAERIVDSYRAQYPEIPDLWSSYNVMLKQMIEGREDKLHLPSGLSIHYPNLRTVRSEESGRVETYYDDPHGSSSSRATGSLAGRSCGSARRIYGAKVVENVSQALARIVITDAAVRLYQTTGYAPWLSTHDSLDYCVPEGEAEDMNVELARQFAVVPGWAEGLPLASEGGWGVTLLNAERGVNR